MTPDPTDSIQIIARELANTVQGIDQLKSGQAQLVRDNAELAEHLKATQEAARHNADLAEDLKATLTQMARDNVNFAEQLKANREQMANITEQLKGSQEQIARLVASDQKPRPRTPASSPLPIASSSRRPVPPRPSPPQARVQTHDSRDQDTIRQ
jgi:chromosome segregation ATPase